MTAERRSGVAVVAAFSLEQLLWSPRTLAMTGLALLPTALVLAVRAANAAGIEMPFSGVGSFSLVTATVGFQFVLPLLALVYATGLVNEEVESGALAYLISRPQSRFRLLAGKIAGSFALQALVFVPALVLSYYLAVAPHGWRALGAHFPTLGLDIVVGLLGLSAYSGVFVAAGTALRRPVLPALGFVFGWEAFVVYIPGFLQKLTLAHYLRSLLPHESLEGAVSSFLAGKSSRPAALFALLLVAALSHGLALWLFSRKEYPVRGD